MRPARLAPHPPHLLEPRVVRAARGAAAGGAEVLLQERPQRAEAVRAIADGRGDAVIAEPGLAFFDDEAGIFQQAQVPRHAGLGEPQDAGQLGHVEPLAVEEPQEAQPRLVAEQPEQPGGLYHIN